jgi:hypothetical protein
MKKIIYLITALFAFHVDAQDATWNFEAALSKSGAINIKNGSGNTINSNINVTGVRTLGRSAPILVKSTNSQVSIGVLFSDSSSVTEDGLGGFEYKSKADTQAAGYDVDPIPVIQAINDSLNFHLIFNYQRNAKDRPNSTIMRVLDGTSSYGGTPYMYADLVVKESVRSTVGITGSFDWYYQPAGQPWPDRYYVYINSFNAPQYFITNLIGETIMTETISCYGGGYYNDNSVSDNRMLCRIYMDNGVETVVSYDCFPATNETSCGTASRTTPRAGNQDGVVLNHDLFYFTTKKHNLFASPQGSRIVAIDKSYSNVMPVEMEDAITSNKMYSSTFGGGTHVYVSGTEIYSWDDETGNSVKLLDIPAGKPVIGNISGIK